MPAAEVFEEEFFASLYDCLNPWSASDDFYVDRAVEAGDPVLDLGCGTGMLASGIASKGLSVTAADPAEAMLRVARSRPGGAKVHWIQSDGQGLRLPHRFRFIYMTGHAFQQLLTAQRRVTRRRELGLDHPAEVTQSLELRLVQQPRTVVHDAERADALTAGRCERNAGVEPQPRVARDRGVVGEAVVAQGVGDHEDVVTEDGVRAHRHVAVRLRQLDPVVRLEPLALGVDE